MQDTKIQEFPVPNYANDIDSVSTICKKLMDAPHYKKMGSEGIYAIVAKANSMGIHPLEALNGGMYYVRGQIMMSAALMNRMIRRGGHSVVKVEGDEEKCTLRGKRSDNGDTIEVTFTIEEAKRAGLVSPQNAWGKWPQDMLFNRALSRLSRQLFADCIEGCYVEGEIPTEGFKTAPKAIVEEAMDEEELQRLEDALEEAPNYKSRLIKHCNGDLSTIPKKSLPTVWVKIEEEIAQRPVLMEKEVENAL